MKETPKPLPLCGPSAFPNDTSNGMTLRDYFAAKAMQSLIAYHSIKGGPEAQEEKGSFMDELTAYVVGAEIPNTTINGIKATYGLIIAGDAYGIADAMLQARKASP